MGVFITTSDALVPDTASSVRRATEKDLSRYLTSILKAQRKCNEDNDISVVNDRPASQKLTTAVLNAMKNALTAAKDFRPTAQFSILQVTASVVLNEEVQTNDLCMFHSSKYPSFLREHGWDLLELVEPFMFSATGDEDMSAEVRRLATSIFRRISRSVKENEVIMLAVEKMSLVNWAAIASDEDACVTTAIRMVEYFGIYGEAMEVMIAPKMILGFSDYPVRFCAQTLDFLQDVIVQHASWGDRKRKSNRWDHVVFAMSNTVLDFIEYSKNTTMVNNRHPLYSMKGQKPKSTDIGQDNEEVKRWYLAVYLLLLVFDKVVLNLDMDLTTIYTHRYPWKYNTKRAFENKADTLKMYTPGGNNGMLDLAFRCMRSAKSLGVTFDGISRLKRYLGEPVVTLSRAEKAKNEREKVNSNMFPLSDDGVTALLAISIYDTYIFGPAFNIPSTGLLPMVLNPEWIGREFLAHILNLMTNPDQSARVDKALFLFIFLAQRVDYVVSGDTFMDLELPVSQTWERGESLKLESALQRVVIVAASSSNPDVRYVAYQLISCFIDMCAPEAKLMVFLSLLEDCPYGAMKAAAIGLLKDRIAQALDKGVGEPFNLPIIGSKLFPAIFAKPIASELWPTLDIHMQALNLLLFLLMRDAPSSPLALWGDFEISKITSKYIRPLEQAIEEVSAELTEAEDESSQSQLLHLNLLQHTLVQVNEKLSTRT
ncbi:hypothetical protein BJV82DRAFT_655267 [Fennellomyces sp. T-0311]|nr:hypothetical protein BJV82DRAFT_655267 [Fennellomyces sp. T-0311]